ncbi:MAG: L-aspartate oxidase [Limnochordia bacterium]|nr:L-aspartate oxidase [Limnochordia bacterium]
MVQGFHYTDYLVIGSGIAGLFAALNLAEHGKVVLLTKCSLEDSNSYFAQGGMAAALAKPDSPELHEQDTLRAGAGLCDEAAVRVLVEEGPKRVRELIEWGVEFDRVDGHIALTREAAHSRGRILHALGDSTGKAISERLALLTKSHSSIAIKEYHNVAELLVEKGRCQGALVVNPNHQLEVFLARAVILASGGAGRVYSETSNPEAATGDGMALAYRAGAKLKDMEFIQFHPTVLLATADHPRFLVSEAVRGEGAILRNIHGEPFMRERHPLADLAPRDVVAQAIWWEMEKTKASHVYLDATSLGADQLQRRFPTIWARCQERGLSMDKDYIPVSPAAHYIMGGVQTDLAGATSIPALFACGEVACTGVHGANRLASNSLLETVVFGRRAAEAAVSYGSSNPLPCLSNEFARSLTTLSGTRSIDGEVLRTLKERIQKTLWDLVGIVRCNKSLAKAEITLGDLTSQVEEVTQGVWYKEALELRNILLMGKLITKAALTRTESRGAHFRTDTPQAQDVWRKHIILQKGLEAPVFTDVG